MVVQVAVLQRYLFEYTQYRPARKFDRSKQHTLPGHYSQLQILVGELVWYRLVDKY